MEQPTPNLKKAVILLSGGLDSGTSAAIAKNAGYELYGLSFDYGQRHLREIESAKKVAEFLQFKELKTIKVDFLKDFGNSALTSEIEVPKGRNIKEMQEEIPVTYVPVRNLIFLSIARAYAEVIGAESIFTGMNYIDYSGYPDCRPEFIQAFEIVGNLASKNFIQNLQPTNIRTPLLHLNKASIIRQGSKLGFDYGLTWSCYEGGQKACGKCDSCLLRLKGFEEAGLTDSIEYEN